MSLSNKIYLSRPVVLEILSIRGYDTSNYKNISYEEIDIMLKNSPSKNKDKSPLDIEVSNESSKTLVKFILTPKIRSSNIVSLAESLLENFEPGDTIMIIIKDKLSADESLENNLKQIYDKTSIFVQYFWINQLTFNVTEHHLVPKHEIISEEELSKLIKNLNIKNVDSLPSIKMTDPISKFYGIKEGQVFKITRRSESSGECIVYRHCKM
jgi:DNA-directed RNA polymerases I, II, and III subunit RPABC1